MGSDPRFLARSKAFTDEKPSQREVSAAVMIGLP
jgi:hypothetical protein